MRVDKSKKINIIDIDGTLRVEAPILKRR